MTPRVRRSGPSTSSPARPSFRPSGRGGWARPVRRQLHEQPALDPLFETEPERYHFCIASDLFSLQAPHSASLEAVLERANDIIFASAPRWAIGRLRREYELRQRLDPTGPAVTLFHLIYQAGADELAAKSFDFSPSSI